MDKKALESLKATYNKEFRLEDDSKKNVGTMLPNIVEQCLDMVECELATPGLFSEAGDTALVHKALDDYLKHTKNGGNFKLKDITLPGKKMSAIDAATVLKLFIRFDTSTSFFTKTFITNILTKLGLSTDTESIFPDFDTEYDATTHKWNEMRQLQKRAEQTRIKLGVWIREKGKLEELK
ncbi:hypothetical protein Ddc_00122 [Ditylenchus destructor]|nr:hypothetical protein Ddc_00122 [Ditylenchus destructor]